MSLNKNIFKEGLSVLLRRFYKSCMANEPQHGWTTTISISPINFVISADNINSIRTIKLIHYGLRLRYLQTKQNDGCEPQPAVDGVHVGNGWHDQVVGVEHGLQSHGRENESQAVDPSMQNLDVDLPVIPENTVRQHCWK